MADGNVEKIDLEIIESLLEKLFDEVVEKKQKNNKETLLKRLKEMK